MTDGAFTKGDWCKLTVYGVKGNEVTGHVDFYLADYRSDNEADHYYVKDWTWVNLSTLGTVDQLNFEVTASRSNEWGTTRRPTSAWTISTTPRLPQQEWRM